MQIIDYKTWLKSWGASPRTIEARVTVIRSLHRQFGPLRSITTEDLQQFLGRPDLSPWSRRTYFNHIRSWFRWAHETGRISEDPSAGLRRPPTPGNLPRPLTESEVDAVLELATGNAREWVLLGLYAGLRAHEIAKIRSEDVTVSTIRVLGKGNKEASIPTHPEIWEIAQGKRKGYWYPTTRNATGHVLGTSVSRVVSRLFLELGIEGSVHRCRHTYGTQLLRAGVNIRVVQTLMRHESLATTEKYLAVESDEQTAAILQLRPRRSVARTVGEIAVGAAASLTGAAIALDTITHGVVLPA